MKPIGAGIAGILLSIALPVLAADDQDGRLLALSCQGCHSGRSAETEGIPPITGSAAELLVRLRELQAGEGSGTLMDRILRGYSEQELALLAGYFGGDR